MFPCIQTFVHVVAMHVIMDQHNYFDGSLPVEEIYDYYKRTKQIPPTTATNVYEYHAFFTKLQEDFSACIIIHIAYTSKASFSS
ncbi:DegV family protein [Bacillus weihaiensis]|uniref:Uncharacterized protein n=1 Tax=Bacillus weihaiensis TaxID=1547283 RepID=A0A1L3MRL2_9BACI|nr:hypothetical protein A9C19_09675 [Bacillus weihaiensis]